MEKKRAYYETIWKDYPDLLKADQFVDMLQISETFARTAIKEKKLRYLVVGNRRYIMIPKREAITFVLSKFYKTRNNLKARI